MNRNLYLLILLLIPFLNMAQTDTVRPGSTIIFYNSPSTTSATPYTYNGNVIKFGIFDIFSGLYGLHYERELSSIFSVQGGLGLTGRNFAAGILGEEETDNYFIRDIYVGQDSYDLPDRYFDFKSRKAKMGFFVSFHPKFYYSEDGYEGNYLGLILSHRKYNFEAYNIDNSLSQNSSSDPIFNPSQIMKEFEKNLILALSWGMQTIGEKVALDYNVALGMKKISGERRDIGQVMDQNYNYNIVAALNEVSKTAFYFEMSLKLGINWKRSGSGSGI